MSNDKDQRSQLSHLAGFDLNLLKVFYALSETPNVTHAAKVLGVTQSALSHSLNRLRHMFSDPLFVKSSRGVVPTPKALALKEPLRVWFQQFDNEILRTKEKGMLELERVFRIFTTDYLESLIVPALADSLALEAPRVQIAIESARFQLPKEDLERGRCDLAIAGFFFELPGSFYQKKLFEDTFAVVVSKKHPRLGKKTKISLDEYCEERHLLIAPGGELHSRIDDILKKKKRRRFLAAGIQSFSSSGWVVSQSELILTAPSRWIDRMLPYFSLNKLICPVEFSPFTIVQVWHERNHRDPHHQWLREKLAEKIK